MATATIPLKGSASMESKKSVFHLNARLLSHRNFLRFWVLIRKQNVSCVETNWFYAPLKKIPVVNLPNRFCRSD
mgnify:CR=1 FL=1